MASLHRGGTLSCRIPSVFSADGSLIFVVCENTVKVFSTATGKETHVLKPAAADAQPPTKAKQPDPATITGLLLHCNNRRQILCSTLGGLVCVYDAEDMTLLKSSSVSHGVMHLAQSRTTVYVATLAARNKATINVCTLDVASGTATPLFQLKNANCGLACSPRDDFICSWHDRELLLFDVVRGAMLAPLHQKAIVTAAAFHPRDAVLAVGDSTGKIWFVRCVGAAAAASPANEAAKDTRLDMLHWHAHGVYSLAFAGGDDGQVLVSGGQEDAVCFWQLQSRKRLFVPHLGSLGVFTVSASANERLYSAVCGDNALFIITAHDLRVSKRILGLKTVAPNFVKTFAPMTTSLPDQRCVVLNGKGNTLQWFNLDQDSCALELEVLHAGVAPRGRRDLETPPISRVEMVAFGKTVMVTEDARTSIVPKRVTPERTLKFWRFKDDGFGFDLVCTVLRPHRKRIFGLASCPGVNDVVCSISRDGLWKTWQLLTNDEGEMGVVCVAQAAFKGLHPTACCFSLDGSVLAVVYSQSVLTLWNPLDATLLKVLSAASPHSHTQWIRAAPGTNLLVAFGTDSAVWAFDLLAARIVWRLDADVLAAAVHWSSGHVALLCAGGGLALLHASSPRPLWTRAVPINALGVEFVRTGRGATHVAVLSKSGAFQLIALPEADSGGGGGDVGGAAVAASADSAAETPAGGAGRFAGLLGPTSFANGSAFDANNGVVDAALATDATATSFLPDTASHVLPPAPTMLVALMRELLRKPASENVDWMDTGDDGDAAANVGLRVGASLGAGDDEDDDGHDSADGGDSEGLRDDDDDERVKFPHRFAGEGRQALLQAFATK